MIKKITFLFWIWVILKKLRMLILLTFGLLCGVFANFDKDKYTFLKSYSLELD